MAQDPSLAHDPTPTPPTATTAAPELPQLEPGTALCLSGGGYRAMLFHLAGLWRLNEAGLLRSLACVSSVSGGSLARLSKRHTGASWVVLVSGSRLEPAVAVGASSAFPPFLPPVHLKLTEGSLQAAAGTDLLRPPFTTDVVLSDGGVYDNLGL